MEDNIIDRRNFFKLGILASGIVATSAFGVTSKHHHKDLQTKSKNHDEKKSGLVRGRMFFQQDLEFDTLSAACERIYPKDSQGGGAIALGVPYFIDNQLAGAYGFNAREYMQGPFMPGKPEQGYQSPMYRREIFLEGIHALENFAQQRYKKSFSILDGNSQDEILKDFESGKAKQDGLDLQYFFTLLRDLTIAGVLADPIYQGNFNKAGWKMMQYPGAQMGYADKIGSDKFFDIEPMSLADME